MGACYCTDTVTIGDMSGTDFRRADIDLSASTGGGDQQADTVVVDGSAGSDRVRVETDAGAATVNSSEL